MVGQSGYRLFCLASVNQVDEIFNSHHEDIKIAERLFSSSLVAVVSTDESTKLKVYLLQMQIVSCDLILLLNKVALFEYCIQVCHFKKGSEICNYNYPSTILAVRLNRSRMVISLANSLYLHNIRDMKMLTAIHHKAANATGLVALSLNSHLAYPVSATSGELQVYDCANLVSRMRIKAHESPLAALSFSSNGLLLATASEKGTVIRVFCVKNGQRVHEFRRGVKRYVRIASLNFSSCAQYLSVSSNTETVHVFRIDPLAVETAERQVCVETPRPEEPESDAKGDETVDGQDGTLPDAVPRDESRWTMGYITKAMTSYFPTQVSDVLNQDRAFASVQLSQAGLRHECVITKLEKETRLIVACEDGFLYMYSFDDVRGGECKLLRVHDLRNPLYGITGELGASTGL